MTITEFLLARIAEDELEVGPADPDEDAGPNGIGWAEVGALSEVLMARPSRVLAECEAKRRIVEWVLSNAAEIDGEWGDGHSAGDIEAGRCEGHGGEAAATPLRLLASVYADHPDFDAAWRA